MQIKVFLILAHEAIPILSIPKKCTNHQRLQANLLLTFPFLYIKLIMVIATPWM